MKQSLSSFGIVIGSLFVAFFITWVYLRSKAESKPLKTPFTHAFVPAAHHGSLPIVFVRLLKPADFAPVLKPKAPYNIGAWLDVRLGGENQLVISPQELLLSGPMKGKPIEVASLSETKAAGLYVLSEFAETLRGRPAMLNLISRRPGLSNMVLDIWGPDKLLSVDTVAMQSESDGTLKELRDAQPRGFYGSSQATLIQIEMLSNLKLEGLLDLKSDMLVSSTEEIGRDRKQIPRVRSETLLEAHRRGLKRYAGPARSKESALELLKLGYDGIIVENRETLDLLLE